MILAFGCSAPSDAAGTLHDARTDTPISGAVVEAVSDEPLPCGRIAATTDAEGAFTLPGLCPGATYVVRPADARWWTDAPGNVAGGRQGSEVRLRAWRLPESDGFWLLEGEELRPLRTNTALDRARSAEGAEDLRFPTEIPGELPQVTESRVLVLVGGEVLGWEPAPLVATERRELAGGVALDPWFLLGQSEVPTATEVTTRPARYLGAGALPAGRHVFQSGASYRALIVEF